MCDVCNCSRIRELLLIARVSFETSDNILIVVQNKRPTFERDISDYRKGKPSLKKFTCASFVTQAKCEGRI